MDSDSKAHSPTVAVAEGSGDVSTEEMFLPASDVPGSRDALDGSWGVSTNASFEERARLIPHAMDSAVVERYRRLRTKIVQIREKEPFRSLLVTSANPQEGKTVTVLNLGLSFAMLPSFKVLVVDGDLRKGTLGKCLGVDKSQPGLSNLIDGSANLGEVVLKSDSIPMHFVVRGDAQVKDMHSSQLRTQFKALSQRFDLIIVDSPPANVLADVQLLASSCDAVLLVARAHSATSQALKKTVQDLASFRVIGSVLNAGRASGTRRRYHGYYY